MGCIVLCYAVGDEVPARQLADFLESNLAVTVSRHEGVIGPNLDLMEATERALSAEVALVLLSPLSIPKVWNRAVWEPLFLERPKEFQTLLGFVLLGECKFPALLRREHFFDASRDIVATAREIKRWLLRPHEAVAPVRRITPEAAEIRRTVADQPGTALEIAPALALEFATDLAEDFEAVYLFNCRGRSRAGILGDIGSALGLHMPGRVEQSRATLSEWCIRHRVLFVLAGVRAEDREVVIPGGLASVIFTESAAGTLPGSIPSGAGDATRKFEDTLREDIEAGLRLGWIAVGLLKAQDRLAEAYEVLERMALSAPDAIAYTRIEREQFWIGSDLGGDDSPVTGLPVNPTRDQQQLTLPF
jgi:hypothetical protein